MVATHHDSLRHQERYDEPIVLTIAGRPARFETRSALIDSLRMLERREISLTIEAAHAAFDLGVALKEAADKLGYGQISHLYSQCGIHRRRAQKAIKFAERLADEHGAFSIDKYRAVVCEARNRHDSGERRCKLDADGDPSMTAIERELGMRGNTTTETKCEPRFAFEPIPFRGMDEVLAGMDNDQPRQSEFPEHRAFTAPAPTGVPTGASQLQLEFDLDRTADKLASAAYQAAQLHRTGSITDDQAERAGAALERAHTEVQDIISNRG